MNQSIEEQVLVEQVKSLYKQTFTLVVSHPIAGALISWIFWDVVSATLIIVWLSCHFFISVLRIVIYAFYRKQKDIGRQVSVWRNIFIVMAIIQGLVYSLAFVFFVPEGEPIYLALSALCIIGVSACAVIGYSAEKRGLLAFFIPALVPGIINSFLSDVQIGVGIGFALLLYSTIIIRTVLPVNRSIIQAMRLNVELEKEIESRKAIEKKLIELSIKDSLTGLSNRRHFDDILQAELKRALREKGELSLIILDVDYFKAFNDSYGHLEGDNCLQAIANVVLRSIHRSGDLACRYGGEEFAIILPNVGKVGAMEFAENLREDIQLAAIPHKGSRLTSLGVVTASLGAATLIHSIETTADTLIRQADEALYCAKKAGRNRANFYDANQSS